MGVLNLMSASGIKLMRLEFELNFQDLRFSVENLFIRIELIF